MVKPGVGAVSAYRPVADVGGRSGLEQPPAGLDAAAAVIWRQLASHAVAEGTLVPATAVEFGDLCTLAVQRDKALAELEKEGYSAQGLKVSRAYVALVNRLESKMRGFKLAPIGKAIEAPTQQKPMTEFERLKAQRHGR